MVRRVLQRQLECSSAVRRTFSHESRRRVASGEVSADANALDCLLTATCAVERIVEGRSTLDEFVGESFG